jgi:diguanylate cyclase (GGDEF)-like protein/PAS domain S-box-containing protein
MSRALSIRSAPGQAHLEVAAPGQDHQTYDPLGAFETILEHSPLSVVILDRDLVVREVSRPAAELVRMPREEMRGQTLRPDLRVLLQKRFARVFAGEAVFHEEKALPEFGQSDAWMRTMMLPIRDADGVVWGAALMAVEIAENERADERIEKLAFIDSVTELPNRTMLSVVLEKALSGAKANHRQLALVWLNLDRFKDVNDALGQHAGDELLRAVGERLHEAVRSVDVVARVGGDDFVLLMARVNSRKHLERLMGRIHDVFATPFVVGAESVLLSASCGIAVHPNGGADARELRESAHSAMRAAKQLGGGGFEIFEPGLTEVGSTRLQLAREIRAGIEQGAFTLHYQPLVNLKTMRVQSVEALARWNHPQRGLLSPAEFIPFAEESGLIVPLGRGLLEQACAHLKGWQSSLGTAPRLAMNVSAREVQRSDVCSEVKRAATAAGIEPSSLEIEFTETAVLANPERAAEVATGLRAAGATVALDDFGTGYSSLTHLRGLPIDRVKIDRSFVVSCLEDRSAAAILAAVTHLAHDLGMEVVAEGVETQAQLEFVKEVGCDAAQGYYLARPMPYEECTEYLLHAAGGSGGGVGAPLV